MEDDSELRYIKELATIESLKADVKSLKLSHKKLSKKLDDIEIQDFHDQIQALNKRIDELRDSILSTQFSLARFEMDFTQFHLLTEAKQQKSTMNYQEMRGHIILKYANTIHEAVNKRKPLEISAEFREYCKKYAKSHDIKAFLE